MKSSEICAVITTASLFWFPLPTTSHPPDPPPKKAAVPMTETTATKEATPKDYLERSKNATGKEIAQ